MVAETRRGQASIELLILVGFLLSAFVIFFVVIQTSTADKIRERAQLEISEVAKTVQNEIELASGSIDGYYREFGMPATRYLGDYTLMINESILFVESEDAEYTYTLIVENVTGQAIRGTNIIRKENGSVTLNT